MDVAGTVLVARVDDGDDVGPVDDAAVDVVDAAVEVTGVDDVEVVVPGEVGLGVPGSDPPPHAASPPTNTAVAATVVTHRCTLMREP